MTKQEKKLSLKLKQQLATLTLLFSLQETNLREASKTVTSFFFTDFMNLMTQIIKQSITNDKATRQSYVPIPFYLKQ